jgi:hypothetical protein
MCNRASRLVDRLSLYSGAAGLKAWSVVSYFLRYFSSTSTEQISPDSAGPFIVSFRLALLFLLLTPAAALRVARTLEPTWRSDRK